MSIRAELRGPLGVTVEIILADEDVAASAQVRVARKGAGGFSRSVDARSVHGQAVDGVVARRSELARPDQVAVGVELATESVVVAGGALSGERSLHGARNVDGRGRRGHGVRVILGSRAEFPRPDDA